jgi:glycosyltransferase involved in cell wall biosynthesis
VEGTAMKLSIIVPVYNVLPYIRQCVDSLLNQTIGDFEIILIDDGSTDGTAKVLEEYAENYPEKVILKRVDNGGQGRARNVAIEMAKGDFLGFIDSDDWIAPDMYEKLYNRAVEANADIAVCDWLEKFQDGREIVLSSCVQEHWLSAAGSACNKIFRRSIIGEVRFPAGLWYEDFYFSAMLMLKAKGIEYVREPLYFYRQSENSTMRNNNSAKNLDMLTVLDMLEKYMVPNGFNNEFEFFIINHVLLDAINRVYRQNAPDRKEVLEKLNSYVHEKLPNLSICESFKRESQNRRIIMRLNYMGMYRTAAKLLDLKAKISK